jgi:hypothetical protein
MSGAKAQVTWQHMRSVSLPEATTSNTVFASTPINLSHLGSLRITATVLYAAFTCLFFLFQLSLYLS